MDEYNAGEILRSVWPEWKITGLLGSGSYGEVYKIARGDASMHDSEIFSESAVKIISVPRDKTELDTLGNNQEFIRQSRNEYEGLAADLSSEIHLLESLKGASNIVHIEDYRIRKNEENIGWTIVIRMELLRPIKELYPFSEDEVIRLGIDICSALEVCSKKNIVHRDIKPSNIFTTEFGDYKLGDFGISRIMQSANISMTQGIGTPNFVAPEVVNGERYDFRADIYSLGMVLYHLLNNQKQPFQPQDKQILSYHDRVDSYLRRVRGEALPLPVNASPRMAQIILKACAFKPEDRYTGAVEMKRALKELTLTPVQTGDKAAAGTIRGKQLQKILIGGAVSVLVLSAIALGGSALYRTINQPDSQEHQMNQRRETEADLSAQAVPEEADAEVPSAVRLAITKYPEKTSYSEGDTLDITGLALTAYYNDGERPITDSFTCYPEVLTESGMQEITVSFGGLTTTFNISVKAMFTYSLNSDGKSYTLSKCLDDEAAEVTIPQTYKGLPVTVIGTNAFRECSVVNLVVPEGITKIEGEAFIGCFMKSIRLPSTLTELSWCDSDGNRIGNPFTCCDSLVHIEVDAANPVYHSQGNCIIETASKKLLAGCKNCVIPPDGSVVEIGEYAFASTGIEELFIPRTVVNIPNTILRGCGTIERVVVEEGNPVYHSAGNCIIETGTKTLVAGCRTSMIPSDGSVTTIGNGAFAECPDIETLHIPQGIVSVEDKAFAYCGDLRSVTLPSSVSDIAATALHCCGELAEITVDSHNPVYHSAGNCIIETNSKTLLIGCAGSVIPSDGGVETIGMEAFDSAFELKSIEIPEGVRFIEDSAFLNTGLKEVYISSTAESIHAAAFNHCTDLKTLVVDKDNPVYHSDGNCIIETASARLIAGCRTSVIPSDGSVTRINAHAFYGSGVVSIEIPKAVTVIKDAVFAYTNLKQIALPSGISLIYEYTFKNCEQLAEIYLPKSVTEIREHAFEECSSLATVYYGGSKADWNKITIEEGNAYLLNAEIVYDYKET